MSNKAPRSLPGQEPLFSPDSIPVGPPVVTPEATSSPLEELDEQQTAEFDRLDAQGMRSAIGVRSEIGAAALTEEPSKFIESEEDGVHVAIPRDIALGLRSGKPAQSPKSFKPRDRRKLSGRQRLFADGPVVPQPPYN